MADLNALIAQGVQFKAPPDPFAQYAQMQQLQQGQQANQLNQMQMQKYQREMEETNALRRLDPSSATYLQDVKKISPEKGFAFGKLQQEAKTAGTEGQIKDTKLIADKLALLPEAYSRADTPESYLQLHKSVHSDPVLGPWLNSMGATPEKGIAQLQDAIQTGKFGELRMKSMQSVSQLLDSMKPLTVAAGSSVYNPQSKTFTQAPRLEQLKTPAEMAQAIELAKANRAPGANIYLPPQEKAEQGARGTLLVKEYGDISNAAKLAAKTLPSIDTNLNILNNGFKTGFGTETIAAGANVLSALGVPNAEKFATNSQKFLGSATQAVLQKQLEQKGPQTESDAQRIQQTGAQLGNTVQANQFMLSAAKAQLKRDMDQRKFYDSWWKQNKTYDGAESAWYTGEGGKSLFDRPELKAYKEPTAETAATAAGRPSLSSIFTVPKR